MRVSLLLLPALLTVFGVGSVAHAALTIGDPAPVLKVSKWVKGSPIALTKGKVHVVEFWATWCGPCKVSIPHLTELAHKYKGKADFAGIAVWENQGDTPVSLAKVNKKVAAFVRSMGSRMDYSVATDDKPDDGTMAVRWMDASGSEGIPTAFIVDKSGRLAWIGSPMEMGEPLAKIVAGTWDMAAERKRISQAKAEETRLERFMEQFPALLLDGKVAEAMALIDKETAGNQGLKETAAGILYRLARTILNETEPLPPSLLRLKDAALPLAQKADDLTDHEVGAVLDVLALAHYRKQNYKEALAALEKEIRKLSSDTDAATRNDLERRRDLYRAKAQ